MKNPESAEFIRAVMRRVGAANPTELGKKMGDPWTLPNPQRKLYKWFNGQSAPNWAGTVALLKVGGMLRPDEDAEIVPLHSPTGRVDDLLESLAARVDRQGKATTRTLKGVEAQLDYIRGLLEPPGQQATEDPK